MLSSLRACVVHVYKKEAADEKTAFSQRTRVKREKKNVKASRASTTLQFVCPEEWPTRSREADVLPQILRHYDFILGSSIAVRHFEHGSEHIRTIRLGIHIVHVFTPTATKEACVRRKFNDA